MKIPTGAQAEDDLKRLALFLEAHFASAHLEPDPVSAAIIVMKETIAFIDRKSALTTELVEDREDRP